MPDKLKTEKVIYRILKKGRGWVFTPKDFLKICHRNTVDKLIHRLCKSNKVDIRNIGYGLYDHPVYDKEKGVYLEPLVEDVVRALEVKLSDRFFYGGEYCCYLLGLRNNSFEAGEEGKGGDVFEKPTRNVYLTNGRARKVRVLDYDIEVIRTVIPMPRKREDLPTLIVQALIYLGAGGLDVDELEELIARMSDGEVIRFKKLVNLGPKWLGNWLYGKV